MRIPTRLIHLRAWWVTGPLARGLAFIADFTVVLGKTATAVVQGLTRR